MNSAKSTMYKVITWQAAQDDIARITDWYVQNRLNKLSAWLDDLEHIEHILSINPYQYPPSYLFTRRALFRKFPYLVVYLIDDYQQEVEIIMVCHQHQDQEKDIYGRFNL
jgi:plasmid stabilization system protein ParE